MDSSGMLYVRSTPGELLLRMWYITFKPQQFDSLLWHAIFLPMHRANWL